MRLTRAGEYGIRCVLHLARHGKGTLVSRKEIAVRTDVPPHFLAKIAQQLARAGIIEILQGANGGYRLLADPSEITLLAVIEAIIGEISSTIAWAGPNPAGTARSVPCTGSGTRPISSSGQPCKRRTLPPWPQKIPAA